MLIFETVIFHIGYLQRQIAYRTKSFEYSEFVVY